MLHETIAQAIERREDADVNEVLAIEPRPHGVAKISRRVSVDHFTRVLKAERVGADIRLYMGPEPDEYLTGKSIVVSPAEAAHFAKVLAMLSTDLLSEASAPPIAAEASGAGS